MKQKTHAGVSIVLIMLLFIYALIRVVLFSLTWYKK